MYFIIGAVTIFTVTYVYFQIRFTYWKRKNIKYEKPAFLFGNLDGVTKTDSFAQLIAKIYNSHRGEKVVGMYFILGTPVLLLRDLDLIKNVLIKNFSSFADRGFIQAEKYEPLSGHLVFLDGRKWKNLRIKLSPTFTSGKMKMMFPLLSECGEDMKDYLEEAEKDQEDFDAKEIMARFSTDVIASCAFGIRTRSFQNPDSEFRHVADGIFKPSWLQSLKNTFIYAAPKLAERLHVKLVPQRAANFFMGSVRDIFEYREKNNVQRKDFTQLLIELKNKGRIGSADHFSEEIDYDPTFTVDQAAAQAFAFFLGGFETSSAVLMFSLFELALNQNIQDELADEIVQVIKKYDGKITYDGLQEMEYLDRVISETLRKYPIVPNVVRCSTKSHYIPEIGATVDKNTQIFIPVLGIHHDPEYFPDPEKFDPDRFLPENKQNWHAMCYIPFGDGPRNCIGKRFGSMTTKTGLAIVLSNFKVVLSEKTQIPLEFDPKSPLLDVKGNVYIKLLRR